MTPLPAPIYEGKRRRWRVSLIINYERALDGLPPLEFDPAEERWLTAAQLRERLNVSDMWLWRRTAGANRQVESPEAAPSAARFANSRTTSARPTLPSARSRP
jgi:hypothetical protein